MHVDRDLLGQAIINLLSNAVKYTPQSGHITLRSHMDELEAIISVEDTGYGIPPNRCRRSSTVSIECPNISTPPRDGTRFGVRAVNH